MIVTIRGEAHECRTVTMEDGKVTLYLHECDEHGDEMTAVFIGFSPNEISGIEATQTVSLEDRISNLETNSTEIKEALDMILNEVTE